MDEWEAGGPMGAGGGRSATESQLQGQRGLWDSADVGDIKVEVTE